MRYYYLALLNYATFTGRASRKEFWYFFLYNLIIAFVIGYYAGVYDIPQLIEIYPWVVLIPTISVGVRRMHDVGKSGWFVLFPIYNIILACIEGTKGDNEYGPDPSAIRFT